MTQVEDRQTGQAETKKTRTDAAETVRSSAGKLVAQQATLAQIGQAALTQTSITQLFDDVAEQLARVLDTEFVSILELSADKSSLTIAAGAGWPPGVIGSELGTGKKSLGGYTVATGGPVLVSDINTEKRFEISPMLTDNGVRSGMSVRIGEEAAALGALSVFAQRPSHFTKDDANFLQAVANVLAAAVERARVERELRESRDQLAAIVANIDEGITVVSRTSMLFANDAAARLSGYSSAAEMAATPPAERLARYELFDENRRPMATENLPSRRVMAGADHSEAIVGHRLRATGEEHFSSVRATALRDAEGNITHAISIFRDVTEERWQAQARTYMSDAVGVLSSTLDAAEAARRLAELSVPRLADYCVVDLLHPDGSINHVALVHSDPGKVDIALRLRDMQPTRPDAPQGVAKVIREGTPEKGVVTSELLEAANISAEMLDLVKKLDLRSYVVVPLVGRHGTIGALSLVMSESGRDLGERDFNLAVELGQRAGIALENAQLYQTANDRRAQLDTVLAALDEAVVVFDGTDQLRLGNRAASEVFGGTLPVTLDDLLSRLATGDDGRRKGSGKLAADAGLADVVEVSADSGRRWLELRRYQAKPREGDGAASELLAPPTVVVLRDVTQARAARAARDAFMGVLSHELRTPITTIYGGSELLDREMAPERRTEIIDDIRVESERLARLVEDLLVMTRVERNMVETSDEPILVQHLLADVVDASRNRWSGAKIELNVAERLPAVRGDQTYIEQVVRNLLTNAIRYGDGGEKGIEVRAAEEGTHVVVRVLDNGKGFGGEDPERLFDLFFRTPTARVVPGGAGIGLFVCRNLVEAMGGRIWAVERPEGGAEFGFSLPVVETDSIN